MGDRSAGYTTGGTGNTAPTYAYDDLNRRMVRQVWSSGHLIKPYPPDRT